MEYSSGDNVFYETEIAYQSSVVVFNNHCVWFSSSFFQRNYLFVIFRLFCCHSKNIFHFTKNKQVFNDIWCSNYHSRRFHN